MKPEKIGRIAGIAIRLAGRVAAEKLTGPSSPAKAPQCARRAAPAPTPLRLGERQAAPDLARAVGAFLRPFGRVGRVLWLEVMGVFFLLFVAVFAPLAWRNRPPGIHGPYHRAFFAAALVVAVFSYLAATSFLRARRK